MSVQKLVGYDCPILHLLLWAHGEGLLPEATPTQDGKDSPEKWKNIPLGLGELAHLTRLEPTLMHDRKVTSSPVVPQYQVSRFRYQWGLLYRQEGDRTQLVVPQGLWPHLLFLAHEIPLAGQQVAMKTLDWLTQQFYWPGI